MSRDYYSVKGPTGLIIKLTFKSLGPWLPSTSSDNENASRNVYDWITIILLGSPFLKFIHT